MPSTQSRLPNAIWLQASNKTIASNLGCSNLFASTNLEFAPEKHKGEVDVLSYSCKIRQLVASKSILLINTIKPGANHVPQ